MINQSSEEIPVERPPTQLLLMSGIRKAFPGVQAIESASFDLNCGEVHALVGENGAGKSTLIKILTGVHLADSGKINIEDESALFRTPLEAQQAGLATIYQEFTLIPSLSVSANIFLGNENSRHGIVDHQAERKSSAKLLSRLGVTIDPDELVANLSVAHQQLVEIARALERKAKLLVMDEPTAALAPREVSHLFTILRELASEGMGILFISHRLDEVLSIADRVTVMRDGVTIGTHRVDEISKKELIEEMVGRPLDQEYPRDQRSYGEVCFEVRNLSGGGVKDISFSVRHGEVVGLAGLMGAGRTEVARLIIAADSKSDGTVWLNQKPIQINSPREAIEQGICLLTEDRKAQGLILKCSAKENFALATLKKRSRFGWIDHESETQSFREQIKNLSLRLSGPDQRAEELSGGNQQKLLVARWLETDSQVVIFDEPTRGIDVGAKHEMYLIINRLAKQGKAIIIISSELPELLGICDRVIVMRRGEVMGEVTDMATATQEEVMALAV